VDRRPSAPHGTRQGTHTLFAGPLARHGIRTRHGTMAQLAERLRANGRPVTAVQVKPQKLISIKSRNTCCAIISLHCHYLEPTDEFLSILRDISKVTTP